MLGLPIYRPAPQAQQAPVGQQRPARQPFRFARNDIYLPPMPEMLQPVNRQPAQPRYAQEPAPISVTGPTNATLASGNGQHVIRGQASDEPAPVARLLAPKLLAIPSPEEMGIGSAKIPVRTVTDWSTAKGRLDQLGAAFYRIEKASDGSFRFTCSLPQSSDQTQQRQFEAQAASEQEAISLAMQQVEAWSISRR